MLAPLRLAARHGRLLLVAGLCAGVLLPDLAAVLRGWLAPLAALMIGLAALRIGLRQALGALGEFMFALRLVGVMQLALPLAALCVVVPLGLAGNPAALAVVLVLAGAPVSMAPGLAILTGQPPGPALRQVVVGTALLPLTTLPVFALLPVLGDIGAVLAATLRLAATIGLGVVAGFGLRRVLMRPARPEHIAAVDGASALVGAVIVIGLMAAIGPLILTDPLRMLRWLALAFAVNFGLQIGAALLLRQGSCAGRRGQSWHRGGQPQHHAVPGGPAGRGHGAPVGLHRLLPVPDVSDAAADGSLPCADPRGSIGRPWLRSH